MESVNKKRYILLFLIILFVLIFFVFLFFYFNIYILIGMVLFIIILSLIYLISSKNNKDIDEDDYYDIESEIEDSIQESIEYFSLEHFYVYVKDVLNLVGNCYSKNNVSILNDFVGKDLIKKINKNIEEYSSSGNTRVISGINVRELKAVNYYTSFGYQYIELSAVISKIDCNVQNGVVVEGNKKNGIFQDYKLVFCKKNGDYTPNVIEKCPSCGALSSTFSHGKCLKCGNVVINMNGFYLIKMDED